MNDIVGKGKKDKSTPERKREYVQHWLENNLNDYWRNECNEEYRPASALLHSPNQNPNVASACASQVSPILGSKRLATSSVLGSRRRVSKRLKLADKPSESCENNDVKSSNLISKTARVTEPQEKLVPAKRCNESIKEIAAKVAKVIEQPCSQLIESISSGHKSHDNSEILFEEAHSSNDKTESDLIEDISTQLVIEANCHKKHVPLSQNISNPSSGSEDGERTCNNGIKLENHSSRQLLDSYASSNPIDTVSTPESRVDIFGKTSYILPYAEEKQQKKKNPKKGSLLELLSTAMAKERSSVNILRHQLSKNINIASDKSFVLLQIIQHLPATIDGSSHQLFKCVLISDSAGLLNDLFSSETNRPPLTVMSVPEISSLVNTNEKPVLKVYEPLTILDLNQLLVHVTRFVALSPTDSQILNFSADMQESSRSKNLKVVRQFHCPCLDEKVLSSKCETKYTDRSENAVLQMLFDYPCILK